MPADEPHYDSRGPVFISYRHSDGERTAHRVADLLRAAGVPVWMDKSDLTTGVIEDRVAQAMSSGLSGGVLVVTPDTSRSEVIKGVEAPGLLKILDADPTFSLSVINATSTGRRIDWSEPDERLATKKGTLKGIKQFPAPRGDLSEQTQKELVTAYVRDHAAALAAGADTLEMNIETRVGPPSSARAEHHLDMYLRSPAVGEVISRQGLEDLQTTLGIVREAIGSSGTSCLRVSGRAHLSVAFALGAQFPRTLIGRTECVDGEGGVWPSASPAAPGGLITEVRPDTDRLAATKEVAVYVDLLDSRNDKAFTEFVDARAGSLNAWSHVRLTRNGQIDPDMGSAIATQVSERIRRLSYDYDARVHLFLRCPLAIAFLVGRLANTLRLTVYEYSKTDHRYIPALAVTTAESGNVIEEVLAPGPGQKN